MSNELKRHQLSAMFPDMGPDEFSDLVSSIKKNGYIGEPIMLLDGQIIDGWHRYAASIKAGLSEIDTQEYKLDIDPMEYVISINSNRRHLTTSQRAIIAAKMITATNGGTQKEGAITTDAAAKKMNVSARTVSNAKKVIAKASAEDVEDIKSGEKTVAEIIAEMKAMGFTKPKPRAKPQPKPKYDPMPIAPNEYTKDTIDKDDLDIQMDVYGEGSREWLLDKIIPKDYNLQQQRLYIRVLRKYATDLQNKLDTRLEHKSQREFDSIINDVWKLEEENDDLKSMLGDHHAKMRSENIIEKGIEKAGSAKGLADDVEGLTEQLISQYKRMITKMVPKIEKYLDQAS